jgi:hypothetical protein
MDFADIFAEGDTPCHLLWHNHIQQSDAQEDDSTYGVKQAKEEQNENRRRMRRRRRRMRRSRWSSMRMRRSIIRSRSWSMKLW